MKRIAALIAMIMILICSGCTPEAAPAELVATTLPVYEFTASLCHGTPLQVHALITEEISCLHDYTLTVSQMRAIESCEYIVISGAGLESFLDDVLPPDTRTVDASAGIELLCYEQTHTHDAYDHQKDNGHHHEEDPHIWLSPANAQKMTENIYLLLCNAYPQYEGIFTENFHRLADDFSALTAYAKEKLSTLSCREIVTFHDGFSYMAEAFDLTILHSVEEESGSEASALELIQLCRIVEQHALPAVFTEAHGSTASASVVSAETGTKAFSLNMAISADSYFAAMYNNIDTLKEALG